MVIARELDKTKDLEDIGGDGNAGVLNLGLAATLTDAKAFIDYSHRLVADDSYRLSAFAKAQAGFSEVGGNWNPDVSAIAGLRLEW